MPSTVPLTFSAFQVAPAGQMYEQEFLSVLASVEKDCPHWIARNILEITQKNNIATHPVIGYREFPGQGVGGAVEVQPGVYRAMVVGTREFLAECGLQVPELLEVSSRRWLEEGSKVIYGGWDGWVRGILKFAPVS